MTPEEYLDFLRTCPDRALTPDLQAARANLLAHDASTGRPVPGETPEQRELRELRAELDVGGGRPDRILTPAQIEALAETEPEAAEAARRARRDYERLSEQLLAEVDADYHTDDARCGELLDEMSPQMLAQLFADHPDIQSRLYAGVTDEEVRDRLQVGVRYQRLLDAHARVEASEPAVRAEQRMRDLRAARTARAALASEDGSLPSVGETSAHVRAVMAARGVDAEEAAQLIVSDPQGTLAAVYARPEPIAGDDPVAVNDAMRLQLQRIEALPEGEREAARALLQRGLGLQPARLSPPRGRESARLDRIGQDVAALDGLPDAERDREMARLAEEHGLMRIEGGRRVPDVARLQALCDRGRDQIGRRLRATGADREIAAFCDDPEGSIDPGDVRRRAEAISAQTGIPTAAIVAEIDRRRTAQATATIAATFGDDPEARAHLRREAELRGQTAAQFEDHLLRRDADEITDPRLRAVPRSADRERAAGPLHRRPAPRARSEPARAGHTGLRRLRGAAQPARRDAGRRRQQPGGDGPVPADGRAGAAAIRRRDGRAGTQRRADVLPAAEPHDRRRARLRSPLPDEPLGQRRSDRPHPRCDRHDPGRQGARGRGHRRPPSGRSNPDNDRYAGLRDRGIAELQPRPRQHRPIGAAHGAAGDDPPGAGAVPHRPRAPSSRAGARRA